MGLRSWLRWVGAGSGAQREEEGEPPAAAPPPRGEAPWTEPVVVPIEDALDLHTFRPREARAVVTSYLEEARARGFTVVRVIHGKGTGALKRSIRAHLLRDPSVARFEDAPPHLGVWGATMVWLNLDDPPRPPGGPTAGGPS